MKNLHLFIPQFSWFDETLRYLSCTCISYQFHLEENLNLYVGFKCIN